MADYNARPAARILAREETAGTRQVPIRKRASQGK